MNKLFNDAQMRQLILGYMYSRNQESPHDLVSTADIAAFLSACQTAVFTAESIKLAAEGQVFIRWDKDTNIFSFGITPKGEAIAEVAAIQAQNPESSGHDNF